MLNTTNMCIGSSAASLPYFSYKLVEHHNFYIVPSNYQNNCNYGCYSKDLS